MITGGFGLYCLLALILVVVAAWIGKTRFSFVFKSYTAGIALINNLIAERLFAAKTIPVQKNCPNCAEPTPISALFCDACEYNFLSEMVGTRQKSLPAPVAVNR